MSASEPPELSSMLMMVDCWGAEEVAGGWLGGKGNLERGSGSAVTTAIATGTWGPWVRAPICKFTDLHKE